MFRSLTVHDSIVKSHHVLRIIRLYLTPRLLTSGRIVDTHCVTPHGEKPLSVADYERSTGKQSKDRQKDIWERLGLGDPFQEYSQGNEEISKPKGYND